MGIIEAPGDEGIILDDMTGPRPVPGVPTDGPAGGPRRNTRPRSLFQGRLTPQLYDIPLEYILFARAWGCGHPKENIAHPEAPDYGWGSVEALFSAWLTDVVHRDIVDDLDRETPEYQWDELFWAQLPVRLQARLLQQQQTQVAQILQTNRAVWLAELRDSGKMQWSYDEVQALLTREEDWTDAETRP